MLYDTISGESVMIAGDVVVLGGGVNKGLHVPHGMQAGSASMFCLTGKVDLLSANCADPSFALSFLNFSGRVGIWAALIS